jgi:N-methylhydantoinase A
MAVVIVGVDVGGTFTDVAAWDGEMLRTAKVTTTPDQSLGVISGAGEVVAGAVDELLHGTTIATNALLERRGASVHLVTDPGFEDVIEIGRQDRPSLYDSFAQRSQPLVPRNRRSPSVDDIDPDDVEAVAVALLRSYSEPEREQAVAAAIADLAPLLPVTLSSEVAPEFREYERTSTTVLNAYLLPVVSRYLTNLVAAARAGGLAGTVSVMRSSGGLIDGDEAARLPASILLSGPAGGAVAASAFGSALGFDRVIAFDMGGTSTDVCRIENGRPEVAYERAVDGYACRMPSVAINTVGAGGGSIGWVDPGGALRVGPQSAGANPGPTCYGRGGTEATVTDADVVLGRISSDAALGGRLRLDAAAARPALDDLGERIGLDASAAALGMVEVVEEVMAGAVRSVSIEEGADPRRAWLIAFGGAGGLHATALARRLDMAGVVIPPHGGVLSALGLLLSPRRVDLARSVLLVEEDGPRLDDEIRRIGDEARQRMAAGSITTICDMRYLGQSHEMSVAYRPGEGWPSLVARFHAAHLERNGFAREGDAVELTTVRAEAVAPPPLTLDRLPPWRGSGATTVVRRPVLTQAGTVDAEVVSRGTLEIGATIVGPAVVEEEQATTYLASGERAVVHETGALVITW